MSMADPNLSSFIWSVADLLRGDYKQSEYGKVILPFTVLRRLDCVLEATKVAVLAEKEAREKALLAVIIEKVNDLFQGELSDQDKLVYVNNVIKGKLLESETLRQQATNNTKEQFANSPDLKTELMNAIMGALDAHTLMSTQALNSPKVQSGMKDILLNHAGLWESLRGRSHPQSRVDREG
jgi:type I restriction-modification system DNA methylase subunit